MAIIADEDAPGPTWCSWALRVPPTLVTRDALLDDIVRHGMDAPGFVAIDERIPQTSRCYRSPLGPVLCACGGAIEGCSGR